MIITFEELSHQAARTGPCTICDKTTRRTCTFTATLNPYNTIADPDEPTGKRPKTRAEIRAGLRAEAEAWAPEPKVFDHEKCRVERDHPADDSPVPAEIRPEYLTERTARLIATMTALGAFIQEHDLAAGSADVSHLYGWNSYGRNSDEVRIDIHPATPAEFLRWCDALGVEEVVLDCTRDGTLLRVSAPVPGEAELGAQVRMYQSMDRGPLGERLPGVDWEWPRDERGRKRKAPQVPLEHVRTALRRLRIADQVARDGA